MSDDIIKDATGLTTSFREIDKLIKSMTANLKEFGTAMKGAKGSSFLGNTGGIGAAGLGNSGQSMMPNSLADVLSANRRMNLRGAINSAALNFGTTAIAAGFQGMPDVNATMGRASGFYSAAVQGGGSRNGIARATFSAMQGGITSLGSDAVTAANLTGMGVMANATGVNRGQFSMLAKSTANAAKYLNIDNATASQALGGLTQGGTSQALMRNFGIYTTDPMSGKRKSPTEIFSALNQRITGGRKLTRQDLMTSMQGGALSSNLANSGLDPAQQQMAYQYMLDSAYDPKTKKFGKGMDLTSKGAMNTLMSGNGVGTNPNQPGYDVTTAQTGTMQAATNAYLDGMKRAVPLIQGFNKAMQQFLSTVPGNAMAQLNSGMQLGMTDPTIQGAAAVAGSFGSGIFSVASTMSQNSLLKRTLGSLGVGGSGYNGPTIGKNSAGQNIYTSGPNKGRYASNAEAAKYTNAMKGGSGSAGGAVGGVSSKFKVSGLGKANAAISGVMGAVQLASDAAGGQGWGTKQFSHDTGSTVGSIAGGIAGSFLDEFIGPLGTMGGAWLGGQIGGFIGDMVGGSSGGSAPGTPTKTVNRLATGGTNSKINTGTTSDTTGGISLIHPVGKAKVTTKFGQKDQYHKNPHKGVDWAVSAGTPVQAAADGTISFIGGSSANTMGTTNYSYGLHMIITHEGGYETLYGHLSGTNARSGDKVTSGQVVASSGNSGYSTGPHLHFELHKNGSPIDPSAALGGNYASVAGNYDTSASNSSGDSASGRSSGSYGSADLLGFSTGAASNSGGVQIPKSYSGAQIGAGAAGLSSGGGSTGGSATIGHGASAGVSSGAGGNGAGGTEGGVKAGNNVVINLTVAKASDDEARKFAVMIKKYMDSDTLTSTMGAI